MNTLSYLIYLCVVVTSITAVKNLKPDKHYRFLAFLPSLGKSHHRVWQPLLRELAERGHHVTYVTPIKLDNPPKNLTHIDLGNDEELLAEVMKRISFDQSKVLNLKGPAKHFDLMTWFRFYGWASAQLTMETPVVQKLIQSDLQFDALILESSFVQEMYIALQHKFKNAVTIEIITAGNFHWAYYIHGNPYDTNYIVDNSISYTDKMTFMERIHNTINSLITRILWSTWYMAQYQEFMDKYITYPGWENRPSMMDMVRNTSLVLVNTHHSLNYPYPYSPHFKEVGGLNLVPVKPLPKDLQEFMDGAKDGVVYFTLGSYLQVSSTLGEKLGSIFTKVFSGLKQKVLMKWESDFPNLPSNIKISKWFPQQDILAHKNLKMFISHGGFLSLTEAVNQGVPILGIPMIGDQLKNAKHIETHKYGLTLEFENITEISLEWAINEILNNKIYTENAKIRSALFRDKPETALETAVFWTEYVIRHNGAHHLKPAISTMPWYQQAMIDVYATIAAIILIPLYIMYRITKCLLCFLCRPSVKSKKKNE